MKGEFAQPVHGNPKPAVINTPLIVAVPAMNLGPDVLTGAGARALLKLIGAETIPLLPKALLLRIQARQKPNPADPNRLGPPTKAALTVELGIAIRQTPHPVVNAPGRWKCIAPPRKDKVGGAMPRKRPLETSLVNRGQPLIPWEEIEFIHRAVQPIEHLVLIWTLLR